MLRIVSTSYVQELEDFFRDNYKKDMEKLAEYWPDTNSIAVDYALLEKHSPEIADDLIENPDTIIKASEEALASQGLVNTEGDRVAPRVRFFNLPQSILIRNINSTHINKFVSIEGVINKITDVRPKVEVAVFECMHDGRRITVDQTGELFGKLNEPIRCPQCERNAFKLMLDETRFTDMQKMQVQEPLEALVRGEQAKNIDIWMEGDLTNKLFAGDKVEITGILRLIPPKHKSAVYSIYIHAVHVQQIECEFEEIELTEEEEAQIKEFGDDPKIYSKLIGSVAPSIYGHNEIKEALALQLFGGTKNKKLPDGMKIRADMHILLIGDPGTAKSQLLNYVYNLAPKGVFVGGKSATGAGLTATAEKDEFGEGGWTLKAGALVLASGGHACIDEFDKMGDEDRSAMHEAMEQQRISIAKAGIVTTFKSETSILAAANPKYGRFDPMSLPAEQFNIPPTLLSRFDLIFPIKDVLDEKKDRAMAQHILSAHQTSGIRGTGAEGVLTDEELARAEEKIMPVLDPELLRKYIAYARRNISPVLTPEAMSKIEEYYVDLRALGERQGTVATTPRQLEALVRLGEASARGRLSSRVEIEDAERSIRLHMFVMHEIGIDPETGMFDADIIATGHTQSKMDKVRSLESVIKNLTKEYDVVTKDMIVEEAKNAGLDVKDIDSLLAILKKDGYVYEPKHGQYRSAGSR
ncbi:MAG: minichromosome maintenance protein MCM [Candidatus Diapherotrites archaeon]|nr:minichromosome maintenance protein MCM [Candidatus Diapherotrites archaeon]